MCRRPSAGVNLNCITNRAAQGPEYKLSYDARTIKKNIHTLLTMPYLQRPHPTVRHHDLSGTPRRLLMFSLYVG